MILGTLRQSAALEHFLSATCAALSAFSYALSLLDFVCLILVVDGWVLVGIFSGLIWTGLEFICVNVV